MLLDLTIALVWVEITKMWEAEEKYLFQSRGPNPPPLNNKSIFLTYVTLPTLLTVRTECMSLERRPTIESTTTKGSNFYRIFQNYQSDINLILLYDFTVIFNWWVLSFWREKLGEIGVLSFRRGCQMCGLPSFTSLVSDLQKLLNSFTWKISKSLRWF